ncbi:MAG: hypothetical protein PHX43_00525 [Alphaproteobacteria bacterium]|nr:hypothetical protein [Alphaproteobacteria bacterium]
MKQSKHMTQRTPEEIFDEATESSQFSSGDLSLLTAELIALRKANEKPLNDIELKAVLGMISYVAYTQKVEEDSIGEVMTSHFGVSTVAALPSHLYQNAIEYLIDLKMDKVFN